ncbi:hypothetical protein BK146_14995 [Paenibacillus sp. FSL R7-0333]|nr:hypothetical protein BK146_14995 [Paenibacillus sp. FSL R7-0333]
MLYYISNRKAGALHKVGHVALMNTHFASSKISVAFRRRTCYIIKVADDEIIDVNNELDL